MEKKTLFKNSSLIFKLYKSMDFSVNSAFQSDIRCRYTRPFIPKLPHILVVRVGCYQSSELTSQTSHLETEIGFFLGVFFLFIKTRHYYA